MTNNSSLRTAKQPEGFKKQKSKRTRTNKKKNLRSTKSKIRKGDNTDEESDKVTTDSSP